MGAWIETLSMSMSDDEGMSLPSWERGLKRIVVDPRLAVDPVAPFVGAWIETQLNQLFPELGLGRSLRGSVD